MIGVIGNPSEHGVIREFFELFKTPWEFWVLGKRYDVILCAGEANVEQYCADAVLIYAGRKLSLDSARHVVVSSNTPSPRMVSCKGRRIPIYGQSVTFAGGVGIVVKDRHARRTRGRGCCDRLVRIGYDLFEEVRTLLTEGQPASNADIPTLELHIALLRELIVESGIQLLEIPPIPYGYRLIACLTHDVDHPSIRFHRLDHTILGFLYRALFGSMVARLRRRMSWRDLFTNWAAVARLPLVYLGLAGDFWCGFKDYLKLENGLASSYFLIPFSNCAGRIGSAVAPARRAASYGVAELAGQIRELQSAGCEIGLHGIDAWHDIANGRKELDQVRRVTGSTQLGVRMHWLYYDKRSPVVLEEVGTEYDSSIGYNQTVGYRAGTTQVFKPLVTTRLLELPLHVMDTALFYPNYLNLSSTGAQAKIRDLIATTAEFGGVVTVNWHDRSLAPERLWRAPYRDLLDQCKRRGAWFATASQAVSWFRKRRTVAFENANGTSLKIRMKIGIKGQQDSPDLLLRVHDGPQVHHDVIIDAAVPEQVLDLTVKHTVPAYAAV